MAEPRDLLAWLLAMPKAELHLHLDGSLRPETALQLAIERQLDLDGRRPDLPAIRRRLVAPTRCADHAQLLRAFELPTALLQDGEALARVSTELVEDVAAEGTAYAEIRWAPSLHTRGGLALEDGLAAVVRGAGRAARAHGIHVRLIAVALRTHDPAVAVAVADAAVRFRDEGLTGFDLAGVERDAPDPTAFAEALAVARAGGLGLTCHAGEWGGAAQVRRALTIDPWRIAHGAPAADDPRLMAELRARDVTLDLCPTSNHQIGIGAWRPDAPLPRLLRAGVPVTISTDDRTVSEVTLVEELARAHMRLGLSADELVATTRRAYSAAFLHHDEDLRDELRTAFEAWLAANPAPGSWGGSVGGEA